MAIVQGLHAPMSVSIEASTQPMFTDDSVTRHKLTEWRCICGASASETDAEVTGTTVEQAGNEHFGAGWLDT